MCGNAQLTAASASTQAAIWHDDIPVMKNNNDKNLLIFLRNLTQLRQTKYKPIEMTQTGCSDKMGSGQTKLHYIAFGD